MGLECSFIIRKCEISSFVCYDFMNREPFLCYYVCRAEATEGF
jgi:hypothetical protein